MAGTTAQWHLIAGPTGAGKTTFARGLAQRLGAVTFSIDEWMDRLFWPDCPEKNDLPWALARVARCEAQMAAVSEALSRSGVAAVLDLGFSARAQREAWLERAASAEVSLVLHVLNVPAEERWRRVQERNLGQSNTFTFAVSHAMFEQMETFWEAPTAAEQAIYARSVQERIEL